MAVSLHELETNVCYLHTVGDFTRFNEGAIVNRKLPTVFVQEFILNWISIFGCPNSLFSDNGGEFNNKTCEKMSIEVITTAAHTPFSNGLLEKHNHIPTNVLMKVKLRRNAAGRQLSTKNSSINVNVFSAYQLPFRRNPTLPALLLLKLLVSMSVLCLLHGKLLWKLSVLKGSGEP